MNISSETTTFGELNQEYANPQTDLPGKSNTTTRRLWSAQGRAVLVTVAVAVVLCFVPGQARAGDFLVTESDCLKIGSLDWAIFHANYEPGSTIRFKPGVTFDMSTCDVSSGRPEAAKSGFEITAPVTIIGNHPDGHATVDGNQRWIAPTGTVNLNECPELVDGHVVTQSPGLFTVGKKNADNSAVVVEIRDVRFENLPWLFDIQRNAEVVVRDSEFVNIRDFNGTCDGEQIFIDRGKFRASNVRMDNFWRQGGNFSSAHIFNSGGAVVLENVMATNFATGEAFVVFSETVPSTGDSGGSTDIVTSRFEGTGGFHAAGGGVIDIVNSIWTPSPPGSVLTLTDVMLSNEAGSAINFEASTLRIDSYFCDSCELERFGGAPIWAKGGAISLKSTVIGGSFPNLAEIDTIVVTDGGTFTNDNVSWVQPTSFQDASSLQALDPANTLLTAAPGIPSVRSSLPTSVSPIVESSGTPGVLLEIIADSFCGGVNQLLSPVDSSCLFEDVFGYPRYDVVQPGTGAVYPPGTGFRDAGAVQVGHLFSDIVNYSTHLEVTGVGDMTVTLHWNRPKDSVADPLTGYSLEYCVAGTATCTTVIIFGANTLTTDVTGLTNATTYSFQVAPFTNMGIAPASNEVRATPFGAIGTPVVTAVPGDGSVDLTWTEPSGGGRTIDGYQVLFRPLGEPQWQLFEVVPAPGTSTTVDGLRSGTTYEFGVGARAGNEGGENGNAVATPHGDIGTVNRNPDESLPATKRANRPRYWENLGYGECTKFEIADDFGSVWVLASDATALILKSDNINDVWVDPVAGQYGTASAQDISHVIVCTPTL